MRGDSGTWRRLCGDQRGAIGILAAFVIVGVVGVSALALEYGHGLLQKTENQRVADLAAYAGALVYGATGSAGSATGAAGYVAALNGVSSSGVNASVVTSPTGDGNHAVEAAVTTSVPLLLARVLTTSATLPVSATAYAEIKSNAPGCIIALSGGGTGIALSGTGSITAASCAVASNSTVCANSSANPSDVIITKTLDYDAGASPTSSNCTISPPGGTASVQTNKVLTTDPLSPSSGSPGSTEVTNATARLGFSSGSCAGTAGTVCAISSPGVSTGTGGIDVYFDYDGKKSTTASSLNSDGCPTATFASNTWTVSCNSTVAFGNISLQGGLTVNFTTPATYNFATSSVTCKGTKGYSICNTGTALTFAGPSTFVLAGGIYNGGGATMTLGSGSTNSYNIGKASDGNSINVSTSNSTTLADATGSGDLFQTAGSIVSGGGTCLWIPAASEHDINGNISLSGGTTLGAGIYTVTGYVAFGANNGGSVTCNGNTVGVDGSGGVTLVIGGANTVSCGSSNQAFCVGAGFNPVVLTAPTSDSTTDLVMIGPTASSANPAAGAWFGQGASNSSFSGAVYFPNGPILMSGSATLGGTGPCLELIGLQVTLSAGTAVGSTCSGLGGSSLGTNVTLVQ